jgi:anti-sigma factor RsiW
MELEEHLRGCEPCARALQSLETLSSGVSSLSTYRASRSLRHRLSARMPGAPVIPWAIAAASLLIAVMAIWRYPSLWQSTSQDGLASEIVQQHVRSLLADHLLDVPSSSRQTVKPWFNGKLDYAPDVQDLSDQGFELAGGRLDYVGGRPVAALVYQRNKHVVNVFVWPAPGQPDRAPVSRPLEGFRVVTWRANGMAWWAVSDLNAVQLEELPLCPCFLQPNRTLRADFRPPDDVLRPR